MICMENFFAMVGLCSIALGVLYILKLYANKRVEASAFVEDQKVYEAARLFAQGASHNEIKELLLKCIDLDEEDIEEILSLSENCKSDDGGYNSFLKAVNKVLGEDIYWGDYR